MKAQELINKRAIRIYHVVMAGGNVDRSFLDEPIFVLSATDAHIVYRDISSCFSSQRGTINILSYEYCDDKWIDCDELLTVDGVLLKAEFDKDDSDDVTTPDLDDETEQEKLNLDYVAGFINVNY